MNTIDPRLRETASPASATANADPLAAFRRAAGTRTQVHAFEGKLQLQPDHEQRMQTYRLIFSDDGRGVARTVEFDAADVGQALAFAREQARDRSAELWSEQRRVYRIQAASPRLEITRPEFSFA